MEQTVLALAGILLRAVPTLLLVFFLAFYLKRMLFAPLEKVLVQRAVMTTGARQQAEILLQKAEKKTAEYQAAIRDARGELFREQELLRRRWLGEHATQVHEAKAASERLIEAARGQIAQEAAAARETFRQTTTALADEIATRMLKRSAR
ncbi:MAG: ATP synthase F0 subunit B [Bryobacteraceae bacterium]